MFQIGVIFMINLMKQEIIIKKKLFQKEKETYLKKAINKMLISI